MPIDEAAPVVAVGGFGASSSKMCALPAPRRIVAFCALASATLNHLSRSYSEFVGFSGVRFGMIWKSSCPLAAPAGIVRVPAAET